MGRFARLFFITLCTTLLLASTAIATTPADLRQDIHYSPSELTEERFTLDPSGPGPIFYGLPSLTTYPSSLQATPSIADRPMAAADDPAIDFRYDDAPFTDADLDADDTNDADEADDADPTDPDDLELSIAFVPFDYIALIEVLPNESDVADVDAQTLFNNNVADIEACFSPRHYRDEGSLSVDLYLAESGAVQGIQGHHHRMDPAQARCILQLAWDYRFPRLSETPREVSHLRYRVEFIAQPTEPLPDGDRPRLLLEDLRHSPDDLQEPIADALVGHLDDLRSCAALSIDHLPDAFTVADIDTRFVLQPNDSYALSHLELTLTNRDTSTLPPPQLLHCYRDRIRSWAIDLSHLDDQDLPDTISPQFAITFRP